MCCSPAGITHCENWNWQKGSGFASHFCFRTHSLSVRRRSKEEGEVRCLAAPVRQRSGGGDHRESRDSKGKQVTPLTPIHRLRAPPLAPTPTMELTRRKRLLQRLASPRTVPGSLREFGWGPFLPVVHPVQSSSLARHTSKLCPKSFPRKFPQ